LLQGLSHIYSQRKIEDDKLTVKLMRLSQLISKTQRQDPAQETALNAKLLIRAGFIDKVAAGIYTYLPLGIRVLAKISQIVREEMDNIGGQEILMPVLHPKENWQKTGRWDGFDVLFKVKGEAGEFALGPTHEEIVVPLTKKFIHSYLDLPKYLYQIQTKFRDEPRAKSGILRGREFLMKDLYSFHANESDLNDYYKKAKGAYDNIFKRVGLEAIETEAAGGTFSKYSHEYQVINTNGEDTIYLCPQGHTAKNQEIIEDQTECLECGKKLNIEKATEVGNIFKLKTKYSEPFELYYTESNGSQKPVLMGCYGIGISRIMGTVVEVKNDKNGIIWPKSVAPYQVHLISIKDQESSIKNEEEVYQKLTKAKVEVLWDDRDVSAGEKFADADLIGIPVRLVVSKKVGDGKIEWKNRESDKTKIISFDETLKKLTS